jgi:leader peptidase (prepilin peptidase) / N-methyltransferase
VTSDIPMPLVIGFATVLGLVIGSFLNVCILRWPAEQSVVRPPSRCPRCGRGLAAWENIPVLSWIMLRGRCRGCSLPISPMYPLVELAAALIWAGMAWRNGATFEALRGAVFGTILLGIAMTDAREYIIPDEFSLGGLVIGVLFSLAGGLPTLESAVIGAVSGFALLWIVATLGTWAFKKEAMGGGDIKMMAMVGAFVGWQGVLLTVFLGALIGTIVFIPITLVKKDKLVPFGIFLALGAAATYLLGPQILAWYRGYITAA